MRSIYLDYAASTPVDPTVQIVVEACMRKEFCNPSSIHSCGVRAKKILDDARKRIAQFLGVSAKEIILTSGGTESNNLALFGVARAYRMHGNHIIVSSIEHPSILESCAALEREGFEITYLPVDRYGYVNQADLARTITSRTILVSIMYAHNETGVIQDLRDCSRPIRKAKRRSSVSAPFFHTDASQAAGFCDLFIPRLGIDLLTLHAGKMYGPHGIGLLYVRSNIHLRPLFYGGGQQNALRSGTENVASAVGFARACESAERRGGREAQRLSMLRDLMVRSIRKAIPESIINSVPEGLPNIVHISIPNIDGEACVMYLDARGIAASTGSACSYLARKRSITLEALGLMPNEIKGSLRFSFGHSTRKKDIDYTIKILRKIILTLRR